MTEDLRSALTLKAVEVGQLLNAVADDDEREGLQEGFERFLNGVLYAGSLERGGTVVHPPLSVALQKRMRVLDQDGREGTIVWFRTQRSWAHRRPSMKTWAVVEYEPGVYRHLVPEDLRVVETRSPAITIERGV